MLYRRIVAQGAKVASRTRSQLKNVNSRALSTATTFAESNGKSIKIACVAGALAATGTYLYTRNDKVHASEPTLLETQKTYFNKYASATAPNGERMMTPEDFLRAITDAEPEEAKKRGSLDESKFRVLFNIADVDNTGLISFNEYVHFEDIIGKPDAEYVLAFKIFDRDGNGRISKEDFRQVVSTSFLSDSKGIPFDFDCELVRLYFGKGNNELDYSQFTQLLKDLQQERVKQEFRFYDKDQAGYIPADKFAQILSAVKLRRIPEYVRQHLNNVANLNKGTSNEGAVSYAQFVACNDMLLHINSYGRVLRAACQKSKTNSVNKDEFLRAANHNTSVEITRLEVDIIWELFDTDRDGKLSLLDFNKVIAPKAPTFVAPAKPAPKTVSAAFLESVENFALGAVAGAVGATAVYPIDLVKTRMQNQRVVDPSKKVYANSWDCFIKVVKNEGARGLYKGLVPQIVGVAPEKAIKLTVNDLLRGFFEDKSKGEIYFPLEVLAGGGAGMSQVLFTNPLEIVKIRLQVQGEGAAKGAKGVGAVQIVRELGFAGLYRGAGACLLRDIPFSAIYFPTYAKMKEYLKDENGKLSATDLLLAGAVAGIPAASLVTPADVIKTRLQVKAKPGEQTYTGIRDCFWKVLTAEGPKAFFKGCVARVCRSSPQFGVTLLSYELLQQFFAPHVTPRPPTNVPVSEKDYANISGTVIKVEEMEKKFGHLTVEPTTPTQVSEEEEKKSSN